MKRVFYRRRKDLEKGLKSMRIFSKTEDQENKTQICKGFRYHVTKSDQINPKVEAPEIFVRKSVDTVNNIERFSFEVKGCFFMSHHRELMKVDFHHTLNIKIAWKRKLFSPKKSVALT